MMRARVWGVFFAIVISAAFPNSSWAFQRMGILPGASVSIPPKGSGELPARCLDEHAPPPTTADSFVQVLNAENPEAVVVETDGKTIPLQQAIAQRLISVSGVTEPPRPGTFVSARINCRADNNLTSKAIAVRVNKSVVLGGKSDKAFSYDVSPLLPQRASQRALWDKMTACNSKADEQKLTGNARDKFVTECLRK